MPSAGFNVYRTYNLGNEMPPVDNETFAEMQEVSPTNQRRQHLRLQTGSINASNCMVVANPSC